MLLQCFCTCMDCDAFEAMICLLVPDFESVLRACDRSLSLTLSALGNSKLDESLTGNEFFGGWSNSAL